MVQRWKLVDSLSADTNWQSTGQKLLLSGGGSIKKMITQVCGRLLLVHQPATENYRVLKTMKSVRSHPTFFWYLMGFLGGLLAVLLFLVNSSVASLPCSGTLQHSHDTQRHPCWAVLILVRVHGSTFAVVSVRSKTSPSWRNHCSIN